MIKYSIFFLFCLLLFTSCERDRTREAAAWYCGAWQEVSRGIPDVAMDEWRKWNIVPAFSMTGEKTGGVLHFAEERAILELGARGEAYRVDLLESPSDKKVKMLHEDGVIFELENIGQGRIKLSYPSIEGFGITYRRKNA